MDPNEAQRLTIRRNRYNFLESINNPMYNDPRYADLVQALDTVDQCMTNLIDVLDTEYAVEDTPGYMACVVALEMREIRNMVIRVGARNQSPPNLLLNHLVGRLQMFYARIAALLVQIRDPAPSRAATTAFVQLGTALEQMFVLAPYTARYRWRE